ncbi:MAG: hypothetical protein ACRBF0_00515 [Calditrichia bacterium]
MMLRSTLCLLLFAIAFSCGPYKELKPKPEVVAVEADYLPLAKKDEKFEVKKEKSYHVKFPAIQRDNYYLVVKVPEDNNVDFYLTRQLDKDKSMIRMTDASSENDGLGVYSLDNTVPTYFWIVDNVTTDTKLNTEYRYVPVWRYKSETGQETLTSTLDESRVDRQVFESLGTAISSSELDTEGELRDVSAKTNRLQGAQGALQDIENLIPQSMQANNDKNYINYLRLKRNIEDELAFQAQYRTVLQLFQQTESAGNDVNGFVESIPGLKQFFENSSQYPSNVVAEAQKAISERLATLGQGYDKNLRKKQDTTPIPFPIEDAKGLYRATGRTPDASFNNMIRFIESFNANSEAIKTAETELAAVDAELRREQQWPDDSFYPSLMRRLDRLKMPRKESYGSYGSYAAARNMNSQATLAADRIQRLRNDMNRASQIVSSINRSRNNNDFQSIIQLLKSNRDLSFLANQYPDLDRLSLNRQEGVIQEMLNAGNWAGMEDKLRALSNDTDFINYDKVLPEKTRLLKNYEEKLVQGIAAASKENARNFINDNLSTYTNVAALYESDAFKPVYEMTYSAGGNNVLAQNNETLRKALESFKLQQFPKSAIETLYRDFTSNIKDNGVLRARAVVEHGKNYKGNERKILNLIAECAPFTPKYLGKPKSYRKLYVVPVNDKQSATNEYMFRINIQIPSDAKFPVFDVNMKLPRELAKSAETVQWYKSITLNKEPVKNEGRFSITAPTKANDYECQITPLQVNKEGQNILEVRFTHSAYKVLEVSVMAQRTIIRKN